MKKNLVFICTGNICRSPMAEALFRAQLQEKGCQGDYLISSAGISASEGQPASEHTRKILKKLGIEDKKFRSRQLSPAIVKNSTHLIGLTRSHKKIIETLYPEAAQKTYLITEFCSDDSLRDRDIPDPIGLGRRAYDEIYELIQKALPGILQFTQQTTMQSQPLPTLVIANDHGGVDLKNHLLQAFQKKATPINDLGTGGDQSVDYPDYAGKVIACLEKNPDHFGILICRSGVGMSIAANRHKNIRAALVNHPKSAEHARKHNNANILCLAADHITPADALATAEAFLATPFEGGRHQQRLAKIETCASALEDEIPAIRRIDPAIAQALDAEATRQSQNIELIASENFTSLAVRQAQGSLLTNKYAEGYPQRRWYGGCENCDTIEQLAIDRAKQLFGAEHVNVQPHSGSQANTAVYFSVLDPGDTILTMDLAHGGHLTHGHPANFSGKLYHVESYGVSEQDHRIDYDALEARALEIKPKMITAGASAYPRIIDFERMGKIARACGAYLFIDMAHIAGLVAAGVHPSPFPHADFVTTTTHKSLRGPRGGLTMCREKYAKKIDSTVFPGIQGGPLMHVIAAKAVCLQEALQADFKKYQRDVIQNAKALAKALAHHGYTILSGGTDNHLMLLDLRAQKLDGKIVQELLDTVGITVNKNSIPFDTATSPFRPSGIRIGTPAVTTRGMQEAEMNKIADLIHQAIEHKEDPSALEKIHTQVTDFNKEFPLP